MSSYIAEGLNLIIKYLFFFSVGWVVLSYLISPRRTFGNIVNSWYQPFPNQHYSTQEFYAFVEEAIQQKKIQNIYVNRVTYSDSSYVGSREYLQVLRRDQLILVCAAPFGTDYFISWRQGQPVNIVQDLVVRIPKVGVWIAAYMAKKPFYQQDTDLMFKEAIHECVQIAITRLTESRAERLPLIPVEGPQGNIEYV